MGRIVDVIVNRDGQVRAAIIDFGGFLGVGNRKIAVDWRALNFAVLWRKDRKISIGPENGALIFCAWRKGRTATKDGGAIAFH